MGVNLHSHQRHGCTWRSMWFALRNSQTSTASFFYGAFGEGDRPPGVIQTVFKLPNGTPLQALTTDAHTVVAGDTLETIGATKGATKTEMEARNPAATEPLTAGDTVLFPSAWCVCVGGVAIMGGGECSARVLTTALFVACLGCSRDCRPADVVQQ